MAGDRLPLAVALYQSPLRDGGYDISDFLSVHPDFGTVDDAVHLIEEAHRRGIRVVADMVVNHTSDQHPWFSSPARTGPIPRPTGTSGVTTISAGVKHG